MKDNVEVMTKIFYYAMTFEKYERIWLDALWYTKKIIAEKQDKIETAESRIENAHHTINSIDKDYEMYRDNAKNEIKKWKKICVILFIILIAVALLGLISWLLKIKVLMLLFVFLFAGIGAFIPVIIIGIVGYTIYTVQKRKKDILTYTSKKIEHTKTVSQNNIEACNAFIKKTKAEIEVLNSKEEYILIQLGKAKNMKDKVYGLNMIPQKYIGLAPVATMYGYLVNGICTIIRGHGGVYERYENDLKLGLIIENLTELNKKIDMVIKNQEKLYNLMGSIDSTLGEIKREIAYGNEMMSDIKSNSAITATASTQSAAAQSYLATHVWRNS